jgi:hypothetical protein
LTAAALGPTPPHPVAFDVAYPDRLSRLTTFFRLFMAIPQMIVVYLLLIPLALLTFLAWFAILFTGRYPKAFFEFTSGVLRWQANLFAYVALLRDEYPPFSWEPGEYPLTLDIPYADRQSRFRLFIRAAAIAPNYLVLTLVMYACYFTTFLSWWMILFTTRYPRGLFKFSIGVLRWQQRQFSYLFLLRDEYPPYSVNANARPGNEVVSTVIGLPLLTLYLAWIVFQTSLAFRDQPTMYVALDAASIHRQQPSLHGGRLRLTMLDYGTGSTSAGNAVVTFKIRAENDGFVPTLFSANSFGLWTCDNRWHRVNHIDGSETKFFFRGGASDVTLYFQMLRTQTPCELDYMGTPVMKFLFEAPRDGAPP